MPGNDYPYITTMTCSICDTEAVLVIEQLAGHGPRLILDTVRWPYEFLPTILDGCEHLCPGDCTA
jgi:hypothetical protein